MNRPYRRPFGPLVTLLLALGVLLGGAASAGAHAELGRSEPAQGALLAAPPEQVDLWFTEPVNGDDGTLSVTLRPSDNSVIQPTSLTVDPADPMHVTATFSGLGFQTYTVVWANRSATDGHTISGSYSFRVGGGPTAGAATTEGENPAAWAVITRWLTFAGLAIAAGAFFVARLLARPRAGGAGERGMGTPPLARRVALGGAAVALIATLAEIPLQLAFPPFDGGGASLANTLRGLPDAWWFRPVGALAAALLALAWLRPGRTGSPAVGVIAGTAVPTSTDRAAQTTVPSALPAIEWPGLVAALAGLLGLALTGHSAAQTGIWQWPAIASNILHQGSTALWFGGLVLLAIVRWSSGRPSAEDAPRLDPVRRFSPWALGLFVVAVVTGIANAGIILPDIPSLWDSRYGVTLLIKSGLVLGALGLAYWHRAALARSAAWATARLRPTLRLESIVVALAVLTASVMAMTSPPTGDALVRDETAGDVLLVKPASLSDGTLAGLIGLQLDPLLPGETSTFTVSAYGLDGSPQPIPDGSRVFLEFSSIEDGQVIPPRLDLAPLGDGRWGGQGDQLSIESWWEIRATVRLAGAGDHTAAFPILLPDPNLYGEDAVPTPDSDPDAQALYARAESFVRGASGYRNLQTLSSPGGGGGVYDEIVVAADSASPARYQNTIQGYMGGQTGDPTPSIQRRIGAENWRSTDGGVTWLETAAIGQPLSPAEIIDDQYGGATGFQLGAQREMNGETAQAVLFVVPEGRYVQTWYVWWVGVDSGQLHGEFMLTSGHYMIRTFLSYNQDYGIQPPAPEDVLNTPGS
ncbi:MAG TPA: CopD family protein [Thermomicrobiales bacterium]|nr:CopD family protein [Thermomicrobiales bacterium]